ncbi:MAG: SDR family oxidoreductase [Methylococcaceae bacterium]|nr:SDR family oxidoreductase [Methylococcaceae bacterium]MCI0667503.1 SDR family oxidoreductase [Methylococcaceae bacterium]MCI0732328.1 SDR family oxidoreductase [Methylococcaceae bacterium]
MARVLVTGGTGFNGINLVRALLERGDTVRVLARDRSNRSVLKNLDCEYRVGDILDPDFVGRAVENCDIVFHLAALVAYWKAHRSDVYKINVEGTRIVMEACLRQGVPRVVHTSSVSAIGIPEPGSIANEETEFDARSRKVAYSDSKRLSEIIVRNAVKCGLNAVIVNPAQIIGPGDHGLYMGSVVRSFKQGHVLAVPSGGICLVDVDAVVHGQLSAAEKGRIGERYILGGENLSYVEIGAILAEITGRTAPRMMLPACLLNPSAVMVDFYNHFGRKISTICGEHVRLGSEKLYYDSGKAVSELGYPLLSFRAAMIRAYEWYLEKGYID